MQSTSLHIYNSAFELVGIIQNKLGGLEILQAFQTETIEPKDYIEVSVLENGTHSELLSVGNYIAIKNDNGKCNIYLISQVEEDNAKYKHLVCENFFVELSQEISQRVKFYNATVKEVLLSILSGSTWVMGEVDNEIRHDFSCDITDKLKAIKTLASKYDCDLYFESYFSKGKLIKTVNIVKKRGTFTGKRFEYGKDIKNIIRTVDMSEVKTAIIGFGASFTDEHGVEGRVTFSEVEWKKGDTYPLDKPKGQIYIENPEVKKLFGLNGGKENRVGIYENGEVTDAEMLLLESYHKLIENSVPKISYEISILDLYSLLGYEHERVSLGDEVLIIDKEFKTPLKVKARVVEIKRNLLNPSESSIILGNFREVLTDDDRVSGLENIINKNQGIWNNKLDAIDMNHYCEFGTLIYEGAESKVLDFKFSQLYKELPVIQVQAQHLEESFEDLDDEIITFDFIPTVNPFNGFYLGGRIRVKRSKLLTKKFNISVQAMCSTPVEL